MEYFFTIRIVKHIHLPAGMPRKTWWESGRTITGMVFWKRKYTIMTKHSHEMCGIQQGDNRWLMETANTFDGILTDRWRKKVPMREVRRQEIGMDIMRMARHILRSFFEITGWFTASP